MMRDIVSRPGLRAVMRRLGVSLATLLIIAWLTLFGLIMGERGREGLPAAPPGAAGEAVLRLVTYLPDHIGRDVQAPPGAALGMLADVARAWLDLRV